MEKNNNVLIPLFIFTLVFGQFAGATKGIVVSEAMHSLGKALTDKGTKGAQLRAKSLRTKFLNDVKPNLKNALDGHGRRMSTNGRFQNSVLKQARYVVNELNIQDLPEMKQLISNLKNDIDTAKKAAAAGRLEIPLIHQGGKLQITSRTSSNVDKELSGVVGFLSRISSLKEWPKSHDSLYSAYQSAKTDFTHISQNGPTRLFTYKNTDLIHFIDETGDLSRIDKKLISHFLEVFSKDTDLNPEAIQKMWIFLVKGFSKSSKAFLDNFIDITLDKLASKPYPTEVYKSVARFIRGLSTVHDSPELVEEYVEVSRTVMKLGQVVNKGEVTETSLDVVSPFVAIEKVEKSGGLTIGRRLLVSFNPQWVDEISNIIDSATATGALSELSARLANTLTNARMFGDAFSGNKNLAPQIINKFKEAILSSSEVNTDSVSSFFKWILKDHEVLEMPTNDVASTIAKIIEDKELFHLIDEPEISKLLEDQPNILDAISNFL